MARTPIFVAITAVSIIGLGMILVSIPINGKLNRKRNTAAVESKTAEENSVDDKACNMESPGYPDRRYNFKPLPNSVNDKTDDEDESNHSMKVRIFEQHIYKLYST